MKDASPAEHLNPLERFGRDVRQVRQGRRLTQKQLGQAAGYSEGYVSKVEAGTLLPSEKFAKGCDLAFGTNKLFSDLLHRIEEGGQPSWFVPYLQLERKASRVLDFSGIAIMGLLQTEEYARAIFRAGHPHEPEEVIQSKAATRLKRREVMEQDRPPKVWVVLHEACLRTAVGGPAVMAAQLDHLLVAASTGVDLQVLPFAVGAPAAHTLPMTLLTFDDSATVLYTEDPEGGRLYRSTATVTTALEHYDRLRAHALSPDQSVTFIKDLRKEFAP